MSTLFVELWLDDLVTVEQSKHLSAFLNQIGSNVNSNHRTWADLAKDIQLNPVRPISKILQMEISDLLRESLLKLQPAQQTPDDIYGYGWTFNFSNTTYLEGAPSAEKYKREETYPLFSVSFENEPFRLLSGWGTGAFGSQKWINKEVEKLESIVDYFGSLPKASAVISSHTPFDTLLDGYLARWIIAEFGGLLAVHSNTVNTPKDLDELFKRVSKGQFPGQIWRFPSYVDTAMGKQEYVWHVVDSVFLKAWLKEPTFNLF